MEEDTTIPTDNNSVDIARSLSYLDRKRKLQGEQLGTPPLKHVCSNQTYALKCDFSSNPNAEGQVLYQFIVKPDLSGMDRGDESEQESAKDSNSFGTDADSMISISGGAESHIYSEEYSFDQPSTSSVNLRDNCSQNPLRSSVSRSARKSSDKIETSSIEKVDDHNHPNSEMHSIVNYEDHLLEFGGHEHFSYSEDRTTFEDFADKELEKMLYCNGGTPNNYVLSSGRWTVNEDTQQGPKKLTIDKEFEQYFSTLML